jgi:hypothetical protein
LDDAGVAGAFGQVDLAIWVTQLCHGGGRDEQWYTRWLAQDLRAAIGLCDLAQDTRSEYDFLVCFGIGVLG